MIRDEKRLLKYSRESKNNSAGSWASTESVVKTGSQDVCVDAEEAGEHGSGEGAGNGCGQSQRA